MCFRAVAGDETTQRILDECNASGQMLLTHTRVDDHLVIRMSIGQTTTDSHHVDRAWQLIVDASEGRTLPRR